MKHHLTCTIAILFALVSCTNSRRQSICSYSCSTLDTISFSICKDDGHIIFSPIVNDSIQSNLFFDTGTTDCLILKSSFAQKLGNAIKGEPYLFKSGFHNGLYTASLIKDSIRIQIANTDILFDSYYIVDDHSRLGEAIGKADGIFPISAGLANLHISFSNKILHFNAVEPEDLSTYDFHTSLIRFNNNQYAIPEFPISIQNLDNDIWIKNVLIDTGYRGDLWLSGASIDSSYNVLLLKNKSDLAYESLNHNRATTNYKYIPERGLIGRPIWIEHRIPNATSNPDSLKIIMGTEFLKGFDIYMDFVKDSIWFKKIHYYSILDETDATTEPLIAGRTDNNGRFFVMFMKSKSQYDIAGIQPGDVITSINKHPFAEYRDSIRFNTIHKPISVSVFRKNKDTTIILFPSKYQIASAINKSSENL